MCEKFFDHVGQFKARATTHAMKIVDSMHDPDVDNNRMLKAEGIVQVDPYDITEEVRALLDEDDLMLYSSDPNAAAVVDSAPQFSNMQGQMSSNHASS